MNLFILGNGFDLMCGATTEIGDYLKYTIYQLKKKNIHPREDISNIESGITIVTHNMNNNGSIRSDLNGTNTESIVDILDFWSILLLKNYYDHNSPYNDAAEKVSWFNIESLIYDVTNDISKYTINTKKAVSTPLNAQDYLFISNLLERKGFQLENPSQNNAEETEKVLSFLFDELIKFDRNFAKYLLFLETTELSDFSRHSDVIQKKQDFWNVNAKLKTFKLQSSDLILNFNYTNSQRKSATVITGIGFKETNEMNIHGTYPEALDSTHNFNKSTVPLIFGFDQRRLENYNSYSFNKFTKTNQLLELNRRRANNSKSVLFNNNITDIYFMGHSLSGADFAYFYSVFDYLNLTSNSNLKLHFLYSIKFATDPKNHSFLGEYQNSIFSLINSYGSKLKGVNNGDYLLTKLMLENRINITPVDLEIHP